MNIPGGHETRIKRDPDGISEDVLINPYVSMRREDVVLPNGAKRNFAYMKDDYVASSTLAVDRLRGNAAFFCVATQHSFSCV